MTQENRRSQFKARLLRPRNPGNDDPWAFVVLPKAVSAKLPRRGRITVDVSINGRRFRALLEPDGQRSHWLRIDERLLEASGAAVGETARFEIMPMEEEPEPEVPADFAEALAASPASQATWNGTTTIARLDWIHWVTSGKQLKTRSKRISDACDMLASGKKRVCCFDPSGYYSKAFRAPEAED